jgi:SAM-dependent methyltransferase
VTQATDELEELDEWCTLGAREKAWSVVALASDLGVREVLEIGSGTGAVLAQLDELGFGDQYWACEPMTALCDLARAKSIPRMVDISCTTFDDDTFAGRRFDLIILSHVLEHVLDPAELLSRAIRRARHVIVEVPIEANTAGNLRSTVRRRLTGRPRTVNAAGHVQFFSTSDARKLVAWAGGQVLDSRLYFPTEAHEALRQSASGPRRLYLNGVSGVGRIVGWAALARFYYGHYALLVQARDQFETDWGHPLFWRPGDSSSHALEGDDTVAGGTRTADEVPTTS